MAWAICWGNDDPRRVGTTAFCTWYGREFRVFLGGSFIPALWSHTCIFTVCVSDPWVCLRPLVEVVLAHPPAYTFRGRSSDPSYIILDEVVGQLLAYVIMVRFYPLTIGKLLMGFLLFRFLDITKPSLIGRVDRSMAKEPKWQAIGIVLDDILAGAVAGFLAVGGLSIWPFLCRMVKVSWLSAVGS